MGACAVTLEQANLVEGNKRARIGTLSPSSSYATGGDTIKPSDFNLNVIEDLQIHVDTAASRLGTWDKANSKIKVFTAIGTEATNASNQSAIVFRVVAKGY